MRLGEILVQMGLITTAQLKMALAQQHAQAEQFNVPPALDADFARADSALRRRLIVHQAVELQAIPLFFTTPRRVAVAMANPANPQALDRLAFILGATVDPMVATDLAINRQLEVLYGVRQKGRSAKARAGALSLPAPQQVVPGKPSPGNDNIRPALRAHHKPAKEIRLEPLEPGSAPRDPAAPVEVMEDALCFTLTPLTFIPPTAICAPPKPSRLASRHPLTPIVIPITGAGAQLAVDQIRFATDQQDLSDCLFTFMRACFGAGAGTGC